MDKLQQSLSEINEQIKSVRKLERQLIKECCKVLKENNLIGKKIAIKRGECYHIIDVHNIKPTYGYIRFEGRGDIFYDDGLYELSNGNPKKCDWIHIPIDDISTLKVLDIDSGIEDIRAIITKSETAVRDFCKKTYSEWSHTESDK